MEYALDPARYLHKYGSCRGHKGFTNYFQLASTEFLAMKTPKSTLNKTESNLYNMYSIL